MRSSVCLTKLHGFTLVELLVVVGTIAILIAILLPTLGRAREQALGVQCASNMRQLAVGFQMYAQAYRGATLPGRMPNLSAAQNVYFVGNGEAWRPRWYALMGAMTGIYAYDQPSPLQADENSKPVDNKVFLCPGVPEWTNSRHYPFGYNFQFLGNSRNLVGTPSGVFRPINWPVNIAKIKSSSSTVLFADSMGTAAGKPRHLRIGYRNEPTTHNFALGNHAFTLDPPRLTPLSDRCDDNNRADEHRSAPDPRHRRRANVAFVDGHVEAMTLEELGYVVLPDGSVTAAGAGAHNRLFSGDGTDRDPPSVYP